MTFPAPPRLPTPGPGALLVGALLYLAICATTMALLVQDVRTP